MNNLQETNYSSAIELLESQIEHRVNPALVHVRLAQLYLNKKNDEDKAADHFLLALKYKNSILIKKLFGYDKHFHFTLPYNKLLLFLDWILEIEMQEMV